MLKRVHLDKYFVTKRSKRRYFEDEDTYSKGSMNDSTSSNELAGDEASSLINVTSDSASKEVDNDVTFDNRVRCTNSLYDFNMCFVM